MNTYPLIQEQRKILPFYWLFTRLMMWIGLLGILFICVPLLVYQFKVAAREASNKKYNDKSTHR
ncbi:hypothetical protein [Paenibacillus sp. ACRRY]|uniref:hypothetical protein n=1 Tax=Paenibacillus sp. ACRRY TaxID=2918208 RepID=UPI001EF4BA56|nr:hypothetical protein [Paenibacillus sp. ACRRY]MCG7383968.1 hypothetical protein [Paenibacillus sp. ACRRY]